MVGDYVSHSVGRALRQRFLCYLRDLSAVYSFKENLQLLMIFNSSDISV